MKEKEEEEEEEEKDGTSFLQKDSQRLILQIVMELLPFESFNLCSAFR